MNILRYLLIFLVCAYVVPLVAADNLLETTPKLQLHVLDVGQGDAILLRCPGENFDVLIDAGDADANYPGAQGLRIEALESILGIKRNIELAIGTHAHLDHIGGFIGLLEQSEFRLSSFFLHGSDFGSSTEVNDLNTLLKERKVKILTKIPDSLCEGKLNLQHLLLPEASQKSIGCPENLNDCSAVLRLQYGKVSFLLLADATQAWENAALSDSILRDKLRGIDVLKLGHHGSAYSTSQALLAHSQAQFVVLSSGAPGRGRSEELGYPAYETIERIAQHFRSGARNRGANRTVLACHREDGAECQWQKLEIPDNVLATTVDGTVSFFTDGQSVEVR